MMWFMSRNSEGNRRGRDTESRSRTPKVGARVAVIAVAGTVTLTGCGAVSAPPAIPPEPVAQTIPAAPTDTPRVVADWTHCPSTGILRQSCVSEAIAAASAENREASEANSKAYSEWFQEAEKIRAANLQAELDWTGEAAKARIQANKSPAERGMDKIGDVLTTWQLWVGGILLACAAGAIRSDGSTAMANLPQHRDLEGPAAEAIRVDAAHTRAMGRVTAAISLPILGSIGGASWFFLLGGIGVLIGWSAWSRMGKLNTQKLGYQISDERWQQRAEQAEMAREDVPAEPHLTRDQAYELGLTKGFVAPENSAAAVALDVSGQGTNVVDAWHRISRALNLGTTDEQGLFTPWAVPESVKALPGGDIELVLRCDEITKTAKHFDGATGPLLRELRLKEMVGGAWTTRHADGRIVGRFSNGNTAPTPVTARDELDDWKF